MKLDFYPGKLPVPKHKKIKSLSQGEIRLWFSALIGFTLKGSGWKIEFGPGTTGTRIPSHQIYLATPPGRIEVMRPPDASDVPIHLQMKPAPKYLTEVPKTEAASEADTGKSWSGPFPMQMLFENFEIVNLLTLLRTKKIFSKKNLIFK